MSVDLRVRVIMAPQMEAALRQAQPITANELATGMVEATETVKTELRRNIQSDGLVKTGRLLRSVRSRITKGRGIKSVSGVVDVGSRGRGNAFYAIALEQGATIAPKKGKYLVLRFRDYGIITHIGGRKLKRERRELISERFAKVKQVTLRPRRFFVTAVKTTETQVQDAMERATERAMRRIYGGT